MTRKTVSAPEPVPASIPAVPAIPVPLEIRDPRLTWTFLQASEGADIELYVHYRPKGFDFDMLAEHLTQSVANPPVRSEELKEGEAAALQDWLKAACFSRLLQRIWLYNDKRNTPGAWDEPLPWGIASMIYSVRLDWSARQRERAEEQRAASSKALRAARELFERRAQQQAQAAR